MANYTHNRILLKSSIQKTAAKKHYYRSSIGYTFQAKVRNEITGHRMYIYFHMNGDGDMHYLTATEINTIYSSTETAPVSLYDSDADMVLVVECDNRIYFRDDVTTNVSWVRAYDPTMWFNYSTKAVPVGNSTFSGGFLNPNKDNVIDFGIDYISGIDEQYSVSSGVFYYKKSTDGTYSNISFNGSSCTVPSGTFTTGNTYNAYAVLTCDDGTTCTVNLADISTVDGTPSATIAEPNNTVVYGETAFRWNYFVDTGADQYAYDIQISDDDGTTWTTIFNHVVSASTTSSVHTGLVAGDYLWRVKVYNQDDVASSWSATGSFICNVPPDPPTITSISGNGRISVRWSSSGQTAYHVLVVDSRTENTVYDSGDIYSSSTLHFINEYLVDGDYAVKVKVINVYGKESDYASMNYNQSCQLADPDFTAYYNPDLGGVQIVIDNQSYETCYLKRDGVLIAQIPGAGFIDYFANGVTKYTLIAVDSNDCFGVNSVIVNAIVPTSRLIRKNGEYFDIHLRWGGRFEASQVENTRYEANEYLGASVPEHSFSKMRVISFQISFDDTFGASSLLGEVLFYADIFGNGYWVVPVTRSRADHWFGNETVLQLELTDGKEEIAYEL